MSVKIAKPDSPILEITATRWSPYAWSDRSVSTEDLRSLFESARWAPSAMNEQPWRYIVATKENPEQFALLLSCLVEANQLWAKDAPVLALSVASLKLARTGAENGTALYDLGQATAWLSVEASARGLHVHQMGGILPDKAQELFAIPADYRAVTGMAIGYLGDPASLPERLRERDLAPRQRKAINEFVFAGTWENAAEFTKAG